MSIKDQWQAAQIKERTYHTEGMDTGLAHYKESYEHYFKYTGINSNLHGRTVVEIGPADFPALAYCTNIGKSFIIEPMPSTILKTFGIPIMSIPAEEIDFKGVDEVWMFNLLQHVINPHDIVNAAKKNASVIRFFEPINYGTDECHLWNLTMLMFKEWFGESVQYYPPTNKNHNFHTHECAYGIWVKNN